MHTRKHKANNLVFACSGAADVGELTDRAARELHRRGVAAMSCIASIGARDADILFNTDLAAIVLLIDGCPKGCCRRAFEQASLSRFVQFNLGELGLKKGSSPCSADRVQQVVSKATEALKVAIERRAQGCPDKLQKLM